jgi:hypothetical protein
MKQFVLASIAILALTATADARHIYHYSLCTPAQKQIGERDPVTSIVLERYSVSLNVKFRLVSGKTINRSDQYNIESDDDGNWHGPSIKDPNLVMRFTITERPGRGYTSEYVETIHNLTTGKNTFVTAAHCHAVEPHEVGEVDYVPQPGEEGYKGD